MKIKYHDNMAQGAQYGEDGKLLDNWNPEKDYGQSYASVHFRVECPAYNYASGFSNERDRAAFYGEVSSVLKAFNVPEGTGHHTEKLPGMEHLYIHPQDISGVALKNNIGRIAEAINRCECCAIRWVDIYNDVSTMSNDEFCELLRGKQDDVDADLLDAFTTKRKNLYAMPDSIVSRVAAKYAVRRRSCESGPDYVCEHFVWDRLEDLVSSGAIVTAQTKSGKGYRTAKQGEKSTNQCVH